MYIKNTSWPGVTFKVGLYEALITHYMYERLSIHERVYSKTFLLISFVTSMLYITWCT